MTPGSGLFHWFNSCQDQEITLYFKFGSFSIKLLPIGLVLSPGTIENNPCPFLWGSCSKYWKAAIIFPLSFLFFKLNICSSFHCSSYGLAFQAPITLVILLCTLSSFSATFLYVCMHACMCLFIKFICPLSHCQVIL